MVIYLNSARTRSLRAEYPGSARSEGLDIEIGHGGETKEIDGSRDSGELEDYHAVLLGPEMGALSRMISLKVVHDVRTKDVAPAVIDGDLEALRGTKGEGVE